jgi:hypothetical protein
MPALFSVINMESPNIFRRIFVLLLACFLGSMGFTFAVIMAKGIAEEFNLQDPWDLIVCFGLMITGTAIGVTAAYFLCYGLPKKTKNK